MNQALVGRRPNLDARRRLTSGKGSASLASLTPDRPLASPGCCLGYYTLETVKTRGALEPNSARTRHRSRSQRSPAQSHQLEVTRCRFLYSLRRGRGYPTGGVVRVCWVISHLESAPLPR